MDMNWRVNELLNVSLRFIKKFNFHLALGFNPGCKVPIESHGSTILMVYPYSNPELYVFGS